MFACMITFSLSSCGVLMFPWRSELLSLWARGGLDWCPPRHSAVAVAADAANAADEVAVDIS